MFHSTHRYFRSAVNFLIIAIALPFFLIPCRDKNTNNDNWSWLVQVLELLEKCFNLKRHFRGT